MQAYIVCLESRQDLAENPNIPDPFNLGWLSDADKIPVPILSDIAITPESVVKLVRCGCGISKWASEYVPADDTIMTCTETCAFGADEERTNTAVRQTEELENTDDLQDDN